MIIGEYQQKVSTKNRIAFPKNFRDELGNKLIITKGYEGCLVIMSPVQWKEMVADAISGPFVSSVIRDTSRFLLGSATEIELDNQGRFVIPSYLIEYSKIKDKAVFLGLGRWVELWAKDKWDKKITDIEKNSSVIGEKLANLKIPPKNGE